MMPAAAHDGSMKTAAVLLLLLVGLLLSLALFYLVLRSARKRAAAADAPVKPGTLLDKAASNLQTALEASFSAVREWVPGLRSRYAEPLILVTGEAGSGKTSLLRNAAPLQGMEDEAGMLNWYRLAQGWILEAHGAFLGLDDGDGEADGWQELAERLRNNRPRRPLDGIVLTVATDALVGPAAWTRAELERRAGLVQQRLAEMQNATGLRLPVYLLITRADQLKGFSSFAGTLPEGLRQAILGWSNPYDTEAPFERGWTGAAFGELRMAVCGLQAELLAAGRTVPDTDSFFQLGPQVEMLGEPAGAYIARLMAASANGERPLLRGIYLCGDPAGEARPLFVRDVLASKVFPERWLARPVRGQRLLRDKKARRWAIACAALVLVWGVALVRAAIDLRGRSEALLAAVVKVDDAQRDRLNLRQAHGHLPFSWYQREAQHLLDAMMRQDSNLVFASIPASWSWPGRLGLDRRVDQSFTRGLENIVLRAVGKGVNLKAVALSGADYDPVTTDLGEESSCALAPPPASPLMAPNQAVTDGAAFGELSGFVDQVLEFEQWRERFDKIQGKEEGSLADLAGLGTYTKAFDIGAGAHAERQRHLVDALREATMAEPLAPEKAFAPALACAFRLHSEMFLGQALDRHPVLRLASAIDQQLAVTGAGAADAHVFDGLLHDLHELGLWLDGGPGMRWVAGNGDEFGKRYGALLDKVGSSRILGKGAAEQLRLETKSRVAQLQLRLLDTAASGRVLQRSKDGGKFELVPAVAQMEAALGALLQQRFMQAPAAAVPDAHAVPAGQLVGWDLTTLNRTVMLVTEQRANMGQVLGSFPPQFQPGLQAVAEQRLAANLVAGVARARLPASDPRDAYTSLAQSQKVLAALLDALGSQESAAERAQVADMVGTEAEAGLRWLQKEFVAASPYQPREGGFVWWEGSANPAAQAFGGGQAEGVDEYLAQQHELIENDARLAQPLLRLAETREGGGKTSVARYWRSLVAELDRFQAKHPDSRMARLDKYIRGELAGAELDNCTRRGGAAFGAGATDFFSLRGRALADQLAARCQELAGGGAAVAYEQLRTAFGPLAGRFPFAAAAEGHDADIADVAHFFGSYDRLGAVVTRQPPGERAREFIDGTRLARSFLAPLLAPAGGEAPGYDLSVRFRVNERGEPDGDNQLGGEVQGNRIVGWTLQSGDRSIGWQGSKAGVNQSLPWRLGMPLVLTLRWAENAPAMPYADPRDSHMSVQGREVVYRISEPWALLRLLSAYRVPAAAAPGQTARFETLRFEIPTAPRTAGAANPPKAIVFLRLAMSPSAKKDVLAFPQFPVEAPLTGTQFASTKP
jgi:type VI secretion system protein ImpL